MATSKKPKAAPLSAAEKEAKKNAALQKQETKKDTFLEDVKKAGEVTEVEHLDGPEAKAQAPALFDKNDLPITPEEHRTLSVPTYDITSEECPDLDELGIVPIDYAGEYWTPVNAMESKRAYFDGVKPLEYTNQETGEMVVLETAFFYSKAGGIYKNFSNASKRLVALFQNNHIQQGTPVLITYLGKVKNSTNLYKSDRWSVSPLMKKLPAPPETKK